MRRILLSAIAVLIAATLWSQEIEFEWKPAAKGDAAKPCVILTSIAISTPVKRTIWRIVANTATTVQTTSKAG